MATVRSFNIDGNSTAQDLEVVPEDVPHEVSTSHWIGHTPEGPSVSVSMPLPSMPLAADLAPTSTRPLDHQDNHVDNVMHEDEKRDKKEVVDNATSDATPAKSKYQAANQLKMRGGVRNTKKPSDFSDQKAYEEYVRRRNLNNEQCRVHRSRKKKEIDTLHLQTAKLFHDLHRCRVELQGVRGELAATKSLLASANKEIEAYRHMHGPLPPLSSYESQLSSSGEVMVSLVGVEVGAPVGVTSLSGPVNLPSVQSPPQLQALPGTPPHPHSDSAPALEQQQQQRQTTQQQEQHTPSQLGGLHVGPSPLSYDTAAVVVGSTCTYSEATGYADETWMRN